MVSLSSTSDFGLRRSRRVSLDTHPEFFSSQQASDSDVSAGSQLTVCLDSHPTSQVIEYKSLMSFSQAQFKGNTG